MAVMIPTPSRTDRLRDLSATAADPAHGVQATITLTVAVPPAAERFTSLISLPHTYPALPFTLLELDNQAVTPRWLGRFSIPQAQLAQYTDLAVV